jgi:hypothetical protein
LSELALDQQQSKLSDFLQKHVKQLQEIEETLDETIEDVSEIQLDPITFEIQGHETLTIADLIHTDNKSIKKVILVFSSLILEVYKLREVVCADICR